jgi:hypothetical protein
MYPAGVALCQEKDHWTKKYEPWIGYIEFGIFLGIYIYMVWD